VDLEEILREMDALQRRMTEAIFSDMKELKRRVESGSLEGGWSIEPLKGLGMRGFIARGYFRTPEPLERPSPLQPLSPLRRKPREPLYDMVEGEDGVQIFIEIPGVEKNDIDIKAEQKRLEVKAGEFHAVIDLPWGELDTDTIATDYRNGVLTVSIPKKG